MQLTCIYPKRIYNASRLHQKMHFFLTTLNSIQMKLFQIIPIIAILCFAPLASAAETSYVGNLSGVECTACKKTIAQALSKIKGVQTIRIVKNKDGTHRLVVVTNGTKSITKADANKALEKAEHYKILSWSKSNR